MAKNTFGKLDQKNQIMKTSDTLHSIKLAGTPNLNFVNTSNQRKYDEENILQ